MLSHRRQYFLTRRKFIKQISFGISALAIPQLNVSRPAKDRLGIALVGLEYYSTNLLAPSLQRTKYCHLVGIVTGTPSKAEQWQRQYGIAAKNIYDYSSMDQIANNHDIDVVYVVLPKSCFQLFFIPIREQPSYCHSFFSWMPSMILIFYAT